MSHPLLPLPERTKEKDEVYAVLGRALGYASEFENNCRVLAHLFDLKESKSDFMFQIWELMENGTLYQKINRLISEHRLPERSADEIHKAREARNKIAHEIGLQHRELESTEESIRHFETDILLLVQEIISGNQIVLDVTRLIEESSSEHGSDVVAYHAAVCDWLLR